MNIAILTSKNSEATRHKVGCVIVKRENIISFGWNGTPTGFDNKCENILNVTLPEVIHAEMNSICKLAKLGISAEGATMYITLSCCFECGKAIIQSGIKKVVYLEQYRDTAPLKMLRKAGIIVKQLKE